MIISSHSYQILCNIYNHDVNIYKYFTDKVIQRWDLSVCNNTTQPVRVEKWNLGASTNYPNVARQFHPEADLTTPIQFQKTREVERHGRGRRRLKKKCRHPQDESWRSEEESRCGRIQEPPGQHPGEVLHQRRNLPFSPTTMAVAGFLIVATLGYLMLYAKKKPEADACDVAKVSANVARPEDTHPRK